MNAGSSPSATADALPPSGSPCCIPAAAVLPGSSRLRILQSHSACLAPASFSSRWCTQFPRRAAPVPAQESRWGLHSKAKFSGWRYIARLWQEGKSHVFKPPAVSVKELFRNKISSCHLISSAVTETLSQTHCCISIDALTSAWNLVEDFLPIIYIITELCAWGCCLI